MNVSNAFQRYYAEDTMIYCHSSFLIQAFVFLQAAFNVAHSRLRSLKLAVNTEKSKLKSSQTQMLIFSSSRQKSSC